MSSSTAAIHVAKKQLGLDDETYRAKLTVITGKSSTKDMSEDERQIVLAALRRDGFTPIERRTDGRQKLTGKYAKKLQALWIAAWNLGIVRNRDDAALVAFVKRQTGIDQVQWVKYADDARKAIEAIKAMIAREGGVDWADRTFMPDYARADGFKVAWAQWIRLGGTVHASSVHAFHELVIATTDATVEVCDARDWQDVMNALGERIRSAATAPAKG